MFNFPITISLKDRFAVVVGCGAVGRRKVSILLAAGARVRAIDPVIDPSTLPAGVECCRRPFQADDLTGARLVCVAVDDPSLEDEVVRLAADQQLLINVAGNPDKGNFALPATLKRDDLLLSVSTGGKSPGFARGLRDRLAGQFGPEWGELLDRVADLRRQRLTEATSSEYNWRIFDRLTEEDLLRLLVDDDEGRLQEILDRLSAGSIVE